MSALPVNVDSMAESEIKGQVPSGCAAEHRAGKNARPRTVSTTPPLPRDWLLDACQAQLTGWGVGRTWVLGLALPPL